MATLLRNLNVAANQSTVISASHALNSNNSVSALNSLTASYTTTAITASYAVSAGTADTALTASYALSVSGTSGTSGNNGSSGTSGTSGAAGANGANGAAGSSGTSGASGAGGSSGSSGTDGSSGSSGSTGTSGSAGTSGVSGAGGSSGSSGTDGTSGSSGSTGTSGSSGSTGTSGSSGSTGTSGSAGTSGVSGAGGSSGTSGTDGTSGSSGSTGTSGSAGTSGSSGTAGSSGANGSSGTSGTAGSSGNSVSVTTSDTAPVDPYTGSLWWDTTTGDLKVYYFNGTGSWVAASSAVSGTAGTSGTNGNFITGSLYSITSSWAVTASYALNAVSASYSTTASYALNAVSASYAPNIYVLPNNVVSASAQLSNGGGTAFTNSNNITVGQITASAISVTALSVVTITSSIAYASGSNIFGTKSTDTQLFTGSVNITGSLGVVGNITSNNVLSLAAGTVLLPSLILATDTTSGMYRIGANNIGISISAAKVLDISSTGLSVTGALSATGGYNGTVGAATPSTGAFTSVDSTGTITSTGTSTQFRAKRTGQNADFRILQGVNNTVLDNNNGDELNLAIAGTYRATLSSTGLAVTGALSATTGLTLNDGSANSPNINFQTTSGTRIMDMDGSTVRILNMAATNARLQLTDAGNLTVDGSITGTGNSLLNFGGGDVFWQFQSANNYVGRASTGEVWLNVAASYGVNLGVAGTSYARVSSTGLAVTGALSSTGLSKNSYSVSTGALAAFASASGGLYNYYSGGGIIGAFSDDVGTRATLSLVASSIAINPAGSTVGLFTTTGLAVTGALDVTSTIGLIRINSSADLDTTGYGYISYRDNSTGSYAERAYVGFGAGNGNFNLYSAAPGKVMTLGADGVTSVLTISATGLAVTGALSSTGALAIGNTVNTVSPTSPNRTVTIVIGGTTYYLAAKTTND